MEVEHRRIKVSKLDAARRQLLTAIRLYFNHGDIVSMHTLASAAFKITQNITDKNENPALSMTDLVDKYLRPEYKKVFWKRFHETANFFKHADSDADAIHEFHPDDTENVLFLATYQYQHLTTERIPEIEVYAIWYMIQHPEGFNLPPNVRLVKPKLYGNDRGEFWRLALPLAGQVIGKGGNGKPELE